MQYTTAVARRVATGSPSKPVSVLVADDDGQILSHICAILDRQGYRAMDARDGIGATQILEHDRVDVMLCDLLLPRVSGLEILERTPRLRRDTEVIMMSAHADMENIERATLLGAGDFLIKPFLLSTVPMIIERNLLRRELESRRAVEERNHVLVECIRALSAAMGAKETGTAQHCERIGVLVLGIADVLGLGDAEKSTLELAACVHDVGKIGVREDILLKPDKLSDSEWDQIRTHPDIGSNILSNVEELRDLAEIIRHHHERVDGTGYPDGLAGEGIPVLARILAVADAFDAMTSDRPYRRKLSDDEASKRLQAGAGTQFDKSIVEAFVEFLGGKQRLAA